MKTITINIKNDNLTEIVSKEDLDDLKLLKATRKEKAIPFEEYRQSITQKRQL
ncbi:MAG TPA: hypothetical protein PLK90_01440 [Clostridiales bacterium]|nr:hypothetical protein [Clostridiales bacterium]HQP69041.1 hypothetical protein [Clostridiales bacterium]